MESYQNSEEARYERAKKRVRALSGFYKHLAVYIIVNVFLIMLKYFNDDGKDFYEINTFSTAFFWGIGLAFHAIGVFYNHVFFGRNWEDRKIRELMEKDRQQKWE